jgi:uncharacterized protein YceK
MRMRRNAVPILPRAFLLVIVSLLLAAGLSGCATTRQASALQQAQYAWSAAIRWGDFEGAWNLVDPGYRARHPLTDLELARYRQVQISAYRDLAERASDTEAQRQIEIGVVNRHTLAERRVRYTERWRWDPEAKAWWIVDGLPDLWPGD